MNSNDLFNLIKLLVGIACIIFTELLITKVIFETLKIKSYDYITMIEVPDYINLDEVTDVILYNKEQMLIIGNKGVEKVEDV